MALPVGGEISIGMLHFEVNSGDATTTLTSETATSSDAGADLAAIASDFADNATTAGLTSRSDLAAAPYGMDEFYQYSYNSCVLVGTEILMADGSIKLVEDLFIDDEVCSVVMPDMTEENYKEYSIENLENAKLPDGWIESNRENELVIKRNYRGFIPINLRINPDGQSNPEGINFPIPGNDDARRSINLYCELLKNTIKDAEKFIKGSEEKNIEKLSKAKEK